MFDRWMIYSRRNPKDCHLDCSQYKRETQHQSERARRKFLLNPQRRIDVASCWFASRIRSAATHGRLMLVVWKGLA